MQNTFTIDADIKKTSYFNQPTVTQNDDITFVVNISDDGQAFDLADVTTVALANTRLDKEVIVTPGTISGTNQVTFNLGTNETAVSSSVNAVVQLYDASGRVSTLSFSYAVKVDPTGSGYVPSVTEQTLIEVVLNDGPLRIQEAIDAGVYATAQGDYALAQTTNAIDNLNSEVNKLSLNYLTPVTTFTDIAITYTLPVIGDSVQTTDDGKFYRWNGTEWKFTTLISNTAITDLQNKLSLQDQQEQTLVHGLNVLSSDQSSPLKVEFYGNTLVNLLGRDGNFEVDSNSDGVADGWSYVSYGSTPSLEATNVKYGTKAQRITSNLGDTSVWRNVYKDVSLQAGKYYVLAVDVVTDGNASVDVRISYDSTIAGVTGSASKVYYVKLNPTTNNNGRIQLHNKIAMGLEGWAQFDGVRLLEISQSTHDKIGVSLLDADVERMFPYVDSVKHVRNPYVNVSGANLLPPFYEWDDQTVGQGEIIEPYRVKFNSPSTARYYRIYIPAIEGQTYTISAKYTGSTGETYMFFADANKTRTGSKISSTAVASAGTKFVEVTALAQATAEIFNPQLELGSTAKPFVPKNDSYLYAECTLAGLPLSDKKDILYEQGGVWYKQKNWETDVVLDGSLDWGVITDYVGFKRFSIAILNSVNESEKLLKFDGKVLMSKGLSGSWDAPDKAQVWSNVLYFTISDTDTGWLEYETPRTNDVKAYFNDWKVNGHTVGIDVTDEATGQLAIDGAYNFVNTGSMRNIVIEKSLDNVAWSSAVEGTDYTLSWNGTTMTLTNITGGATYFRVDYNYGFVANSWVSLLDGITAPSTNTDVYVSANPEPNATENDFYQLSYQLATPVIETVNVEGSLSIEGDAQVSVGEGVIVREVANPVYHSSGDNYQIANKAVSTNSYLQHNNEDILNIYKNGEDDTHNWSIVAASTANAQNGVSKKIALIPSSKFDTTATYTVTYTILDKYAFTTNANDVIAHYDSSMKSAFNSAITKQSDIGTSVSILDRQMLDILIRLDAGGL